VRLYACGAYLKATPKELDNELYPHEWGRKWDEKPCLWFHVPNCGIKGVVEESNVGDTEDISDLV
jgi:hypothetical protein